MILVTGATGTIGLATVQALKTRGVQFKVGARNVEKVKNLGVEAVELDWEKPASVINAFRGVERAFLITPMSENQLGQTLHALAASKRNGVKHIVRLSAVGAEHQPGTIASRLHNAVEREITTSGIGWTMLRPTFFVQNFVNYYGVNPKQDGQVYSSMGDGKATWIDARDIGEVASSILANVSGHENKSYDLTGPEALSGQQVLDILGTALGHKYSWVGVSETDAQKAMEQSGMPLWNVDALNELNGVVRGGYATTVSQSVQKLLGRAPRTVQQYAKDFAATVK
jgi:uncharacterized protein YbjT (DUF2867 family)